MWNPAHDSDEEGIPYPNYADLKQDLKDCAVIAEDENDLKQDLKDCVVIADDEDGAPASKKLKIEERNVPASSSPSYPSNFIAKEGNRRSQRGDNEDDAAGSEGKAAEDEDSSSSSQELSDVEDGASQACAEELLQKQNGRRKEDAHSVCLQEAVGHESPEKAYSNIGSDLQPPFPLENIKNLVSCHQVLNSWQKSLFMREIHQLFDLSQQLVQQPLSKKERDLISGKLKSGFGDLSGIIGKPKKLGRSKPTDSTGGRERLEWKIDKSTGNGDGVEQPFRIKIRKLKNAGSIYSELLNKEIRAVLEDEERPKDPKDKRPSVKSELIPPRPSELIPPRPSELIAPCRESDTAESPKVVNVVSLNDDKTGSCETAYPRIDQNVIGCEGRNDGGQQQPISLCQNVDPYSKRLSLLSENSRPEFGEVMVERPSWIENVEEPSPRIVASQCGPSAHRIDKTRNRQLSAPLSVSIHEPPLSMPSPRRWNGRSSPGPFHRATTSSSTQTDLDMVVVSRPSWQEMVSRVETLEDLCCRLEAESERIRANLRRVNARDQALEVALDTRDVRHRCPGCIREKTPTAWACSSCQTFFYNLSKLSKAGVNLPSCNHRGRLVQMKCNGCRRFKLQNSWKKHYPNRSYPFPKL